MTAAATYAALIRRMGADLRKHGFSRRGSSFHLMQSGNWGVVAFQKSAKSTADHVLFTVNLGVVSNRLRAFFGAGDCLPSISDCHWSVRLGALLGNSDADEWWSISAQTTLEALIREIAPILFNQGIATVERHLSDEALKQFWLSGPSPGLTPVQREMNLVVLLAALGPVELIEDHLRELRQMTSGKPTAGKASWIVARLAKRGTSVG